MSNCKFCDAKIYWESTPSAVGSSWRAYDDEDLTQVHRCGDYKPKSEGKKLVERLAKEQKAKEQAK